MSRLRSIRSDESGMAILMVITTITIGLAVGGVAAVTATNAMRGSQRDDNSKEALAAADAGAQVALLRQNQVEVSDAFPCVVEVAGTFAAGAAGTGGWCPPVSGTTGDTEYSYRVRPPVATELLSRVEMVSTSTTEGVTRRVHTIAESPRANAIFANSTVIGENAIGLSSNARIFGNAATNGNINMSSNAALCGTAQHGEGMSLIMSGNAHHGGSGCSQSTYPSGSGTVTLPPVDQGNVTNPAFNDNDRIQPSNPAAPDTVSGNRADVSWNATSRFLSINSNSALTLGGQDYSFCRLVLNSNSSLIVAAGASVRIFFDSPENCPGLGSGPQIQLNSNSRLTTTNGGPGNLQLLVVGSPNPAVTSDNVSFSSNSQTTMPVILYAPRSAIQLNSNSTILGAVAGQSVTLNSNARVSSHSDSSSLELPLPLKYRQTQFVECTSVEAPASVPSSDC